MNRIGPTSYIAHRLLAGAVCAVLLFCATPVLSAEQSATVQTTLRSAASHLKQGDYDNAIVLSKEAIDLAQANKDIPGAIAGSLIAAEAYSAKGRYRQAVQLLVPAEQLAESTGNDTALVAVLEALGRSYLLVQAYEEAEQTLEKTADLAKRLNANPSYYSARHNLANLHAHLGRYDKAADLYQEVITSAAPDLARRGMINFSRATIDANAVGFKDVPLTTASDYLDRAYDGLMSPAERGDVAQLLSVGRLYKRLAESSELPSPRHTERANHALTKALEKAGELGDKRLMSYALGYLGDLYFSNGRSDDALSLTQRAILAGEDASAPDAVYRWQWPAARILVTLRRNDEAIEEYRKATGSLGGIRHLLKTDDGGMGRSFNDDIGALYFELADQLLRKAAAENEADRQENYLIEARSVVESLKGAELEDYFKDGCVADLKARTSGIDKLAPNTAALYPIILPDRVELLVSLPDGIKRFSTPVAAAKLVSEVDAFRYYLEKRTTHEYLPHGQQLYRWLLAPLEEELERHAISTLVVVPDAALRTIPLAALHDGKRFVAERFAVATVPGLTLVDPRPLSARDQKVLIGGLTESVQGFAPLPFVDRELADIQPLYPEHTVLKDQEFELTKLEDALNRNSYSIVHIASHAQFDRDSANTFLLTFNSKVNMTGLETLIESTKFRRDGLELLTLSACQTAAGDDRAALGLAGVAVKAGARSALATLWVVNDPAAAQLTREFYQVLSNTSASKVEALKAAQNALLADVRFRHPSYWGPFLIIGNWL